MTGQRTAIVFGGAGFIGTALLRALGAAGQYTQLISADRSVPAQRLDGVRYEPCDVRKTISFERDLGEVDIFNFAAVHTTPGHEDWEYFVTNVKGATEVCDFARRIGARRICFTSSISVYGPVEETKDETSECQPVSAYGRSKLLGESIHRMWVNDKEERQLVIVRPAVIFGPGERGNFTRLAEMLRRRRFVYPGRTNTIKACGYVDELVRSMLFVTGLNRKDITYNFAYPEQYTIADICSAFADVAGYPLPRAVMPLSVMMAAGWVFEVLAHVGIKTSINRARMLKLVNSTDVAPTVLKSLGYEFQTDLRSGLETWRRRSANFT